MFSTFFSKPISSLRCCSRCLQVRRHIGANMASSAYSWYKIKLPGVLTMSLWELGLLSAQFAKLWNVELYISQQNNVQNKDRTSSTNNFWPMQYGLAFYRFVIHRVMIAGGCWLLSTRLRSKVRHHCWWIRYLFLLSVAAGIIFQLVERLVSVLS